jgi:outer membrane scaffolding protein for murein synthesis (MipA/OmpV family)
MSGYKPKDSSFLRDMSEKESSLFAGIKLKSKNLLKKVDLDFVLLKDIMNKSKGIKSNLILGHNFIVNNKIIFLINGGVSYLNNDYSKYYFGVSNNEIINERNYYNPGTVFRTSLKVGLNYRMAEKLNLLILLNYENLSDKLSNSPIVRQENIFSGLLGFIYNIN